MKNFKEIAEKCLAGELSGVFVFQNGRKISSSKLQKYDTDAPYGDYPYYISHICTLTNYGFGYNSDYNVIDFIPDNMQNQIKIDVPEGKIPVMEQTENGVVITWEDPVITYNLLYQSIYQNDKAISSVRNTVVNETNTRFLTKVNVLRKLTNIRNYFGKPNSYDNGYCISHSSSTNKFYVDNVITVGIWTKDVLFAKKEHAEQAIKMLGDELKYLFEPW